MTGATLGSPPTVASPEGSVENPHVVEPEARGVLDAEAIRRLRELDPTGESHLLTRVFNAFETSLNRLLPQLTQARDAADPAGVRLVAHTLKSSSATVGAMALSRWCAEVEGQARLLRLDEAASGIEQMLLEVEAVRESLRRLSRTVDATAGAT